MNGVELPVPRVIGIEDEVDEPGAIAGLVGQLVKDARVSLAAIEIQIRDQLLGGLVQNVQRPVQIVNEEAPFSAAGLLPQEIHSSEQAVLLSLAIQRARDGHRGIVLDFEGDLWRIRGGSEYARSRAQPA